MPRRKRPRGPDGDWRTPDQVAEDKLLRGAWYRCRDHGLTTSPIMLGSHAYCPAEDCTNTARLLLVHSVMDDTQGTPDRWNQGPSPRKRFAPRVDAEPDVGAFAPPDADERDAEDAPSCNDEPSPRNNSDEEEPNVSADATTQSEPQAHNDPRTGTALILEFLRSTRGVATPLRELREMLRRAKPSSSRSLPEMSLRSLARRGLVAQSGDGWEITAAGAAHAQVDAAHETPAPRTRRSMRNPPKKLVSAPPTEPEQRAETGRNRDSSADASLPDPGSVVVRLTPAMRARLEQRLSEGFCGHSLEDAAERLLARALIAFTAGT